MRLIFQRSVLVVGILLMIVSITIFSFRAVAADSSNEAIEIEVLETAAPSTFSCVVKVTSENTYEPNNGSVKPFPTEVIGTQESNPVLASVSVIGQPFITASVQDVSIINGVTQPLSWTFFNAMGTGEGWKVRISATDMIDGAKVVEISNLKIRIMEVDTLGGSEAPVSLLTEWSSISENPRVMLEAEQGDGMGAYLIYPEIYVELPEDFVAGNYRCVISIDILTGENE